MFSITIILFLSIVLITHQNLDEHIFTEINECINIDLYVDANIYIDVG